MKKRLPPFSLYFLYPKVTAVNSFLGIFVENVYKKHVFMSF